MRSFSEKENACRQLFFDGGQFWHAYTNGKDTPVMFSSREDYCFAMNVVAQAALAYPAVRVLTFAVMSNHFHFVAASSKEMIESFFGFIRRRLTKYIPVIKSICLTIKPIASLQALRNTVAYVNRNGYVANDNCTPFSYPWGCCRFYYSEAFLNERLKDVSYKEKRAMFRSRVPDMPSDWEVIDGHVAARSYCALDLGMGVFRDAQHYFFMVSKNVEAYAEVAVEIDDGEFLTDSELYEAVCRVVKKQYNLPSQKELTKAQKLELAKTVHYDFRSSNAQVSRVLGIPVFEINQLFPLSAK